MPGGGNGGNGAASKAAQPMPPAATAALTANGDGGAPGQQSYERGLDSGLAKAAPSAQGLSQKTYRSFRRRLDLFSRQCRRRGISVAVEGAFLVLSQLQDVAWDASESIDYDDIELSDDPFKPIVKVLDTLFQHEEEVELPERCQEFFEQFQRERQEELQAYLVRHATMLKKLKDLQVDVPPLLAGWHLLTRSGVPRWTHPQVKAMCNGNLTVEGVARSLTRMFGGDSKPNAKDTTFRNDVHMVDNDMDDDEAYEIYYYDDEEAYEIYYNHDEDDYMDDAYYQDTVADEEIPQDLDEATLVVEDAYINYLDSRRKMRELALSRGFYPVVAIDMNDNYGKGGGKSYGKGRNSGGGGKSKGKSKGKGGGKSKGKGSGKSFNQSLPGARRFVFGRKSPSEGGSTSATSTTARSTTSGSTSQHGPRFKRYRLPASGIKEVPDEANMVEEPYGATPIPGEFNQHEEINYVSQGAGWAIMDSGATRTVCGEATWERISKYLTMRDLEAEVVRDSRDFRFGDGVTVRSHYCARTPVCVGKTWRDLVIHVLPGHTPLLLARPDLEAWNVMVDYGKKMIYIDGVEIKPVLTANNIFDDLQDVLQINDLFVKNDNDEQVFLDSVITEQISDEEMDLEVDVGEDMIDQCVFSAVEKNKLSDRKLKFWEVYVDEGNLGKYLIKNFPDVEVHQFSLPQWNFECREAQRDFRKMLADEKPHHVLMAPECRLWSPMQNMNYKTPEQKKLLQDMRNLEEETHLKFYENVHNDCKTIHADCTLEQPADAMSWKTDTLQRVKGYFETVLDRCRTGLKASPDDPRYVRKPTMIRSSARRVCESVNLRCQCTNGHTQMMGRGAVLKRMQNYEPDMVRRMGNAIYQSMEEVWIRRGQADLMMLDMVEKSNEEMQYLEQNKELVKIGGTEVLKSVALLHRQLGHPNGSKLALAAKVRHMPDEYVQVARRYKCPQCLAKAKPKCVKVATLHKSPHFNHTVALDTFYLEWDKEKKAVLSILDEFSRYEVDCEIKEETAEMEIGLFESVWSKSFGYPKVLRLDASGPHQGEAYADWASAHGIRLELIPRGAHHRLGILERNHAVRRKMLEVFKQEMPDCTFDKALQVTAHQRNRLSSVKGSTPATLAFGYVPSEGGNMDEPGPESFGDQADLPRILEVKQKAAIAFHKANQDLALRAAALARSRVEEDELMVGDYVFYWKPQTHKLDPFRWRGPCMVIAVEAAMDRANMIYWIVHGSSLVRATRQQLRHETVPERYERQLRPGAENDLQRPMAERVLQALRPVRGPVRGLDLAAKAQTPDDFPSLGGHDSTHASSMPAPTTTSMPPHEPADPPKTAESEDEEEHETGEGVVKKKKKRRKHRDKEKHKAEMRTAEMAREKFPTGGDSPFGLGLGAELPEGETEQAEAEQAETPEDVMTDEQKAMKEVMRQINPDAMEARNDIAETPSINDPGGDDRARERRDYERAIRLAGQLSDNQARRLDGLPPRAHDGQPQQKQARTEEIRMVEIAQEEILQTVVESRLSPEERKTFVEAKRKALAPWTENDAWRPGGPIPMPQRHIGSHALSLALQGEQAPCESHPARLQTQRCGGVQARH